MKKLHNKAFTLVELLVVITILAIISVVAYQNFGGAIDKAVSGRKIGDVSTIETSLQQFKVDNNYYPSVDIYSATTNMWGYSSGSTATPSNTLDVTMNGAEIQNIVSANGGGVVRNIDASQQIGAKGTLSQETLGKKYLTKDLYDPEVGDLKETSGNRKLIEAGIGRYVYAVYRKPTGANWGNDNKTGSYYNIAYTIRKDGSDTYLTKIVGDYDSESCFENSSNCPSTLIGSGSGVLVNEQEQGKAANGTALTNFGSNQANQGIPYPVADFE
ncbi:prepilin-type N-terminal cleavage/methylation domain-containing protein [Candidatus Gracilibacteria bacterium]|nr:prepilin-type N-terminal cleavage/methylation domain-containing protein [Candidatus Gracilibacteria bacterium]